MDLQFEFPLERRVSPAYECIYSADDILVAFIGMRPNSKQIANFIVRACNAHDELVKALQRALSALDAVEDEHGITDRVTKAADQARAILAKVAA